MNLDLTRRTLLHLAGASSFATAASAAAQAEGKAIGGGGPTFANRTPMRVGMVTLRVRQLDSVADFYRDAIGLAVMERSATSAHARHRRRQAGGAGSASRRRGGSRNAPPASITPPS